MRELIEDSSVAVWIIGFVIVVTMFMVAGKGDMTLWEFLGSLF